MKKYPMTELNQYLIKGLNDTSKHRLKDVLVSVALTKEKMNFDPFPK